jgi:hypothetical protein
MNSCLLFCVLIPVILGAPPPPAQPAQRAVAQDQASPVPEMSRLAKVLAGDWENDRNHGEGRILSQPW